MTDSISPHSFPARVSPLGAMPCKVNSPPRKNRAYNTVPQQYDLPGGALSLGICPEVFSKAAPNQVAPWLMESCLFLGNHETRIILREGDLSGVVSSSAGYDRRQTLGCGDVSCCCGIMKFNFWNLVIYSRYWSAFNCSPGYNSKI